MQVLASYGLDTLEDDPELMAITDLAGRLCNAPVALVSLVEKERQRFLARQGVEERETPRPTSFCAHTMLRATPMEIEDASQHPDFKENALVTGMPYIRFYAGAPLISQEGAPLGALCVIDTEPRPGGLTDLQRDSLQVLARAVMRRLVAQRFSLKAAEEIQARGQRLEDLANSMPDIAFSATADGSFDYFNRRWYEFVGLDESADIARSTQYIHPDQYDAVMAEWNKAVAAGAPFADEVRYRRADGEYRWMLIRALPLDGSDGKVDRWFGTMTDIDDGHRLSEERDVLARELSHRIKNIFAVVSGLVALRSRRFPEAKEFATDLTGTIHALGRAHDFVRPIDGRNSDSLRGLLRELLAPYTEEGDGLIEMIGEDCKIGHRAATPLALVFHELATNCAKYGAFSVVDGKVILSMDCDGETVAIDWRETGGPAPGNQEGRGFGSKLVKMAVESQLRGSIERIWHDNGLEVQIRIPAESIAI
ncbi:uncharacterized protein HME9302_00190 [Alteripontixanthobacter maritimus]|uniref:histidine kinase n=1 Tax=Alteripontixanthobacter maritimus TaxID=2161824 RepID=A0A369Q285_9SPHN|nr:PAS domain-containing protein [Alteripontixanthobacter maritimus]RDC59013.1 uncharacterized protein HME9302_00190 [Alteripontixanthobacter maritimus]